MTFGEIKFGLSTQVHLFPHLLVWVVSLYTYVHYSLYHLEVYSYSIAIRTFGCTFMPQTSLAMRCFLEDLLCWMLLFVGPPVSPPERSESVRPPESCLSVI